MQVTTPFMWKSTCIVFCYVYNSSLSPVLRLRAEMHPIVELDRRIHCQLHIAK